MNNIILVCSILIGQLSRHHTIGLLVKYVFYGRWQSRKHRLKTGTIAAHQALMFDKLPTRIWFKWQTWKREKDFKWKALLGGYLIMWLVAQSKYRVLFVWVNHENEKMRRGNYHCWLIFVVEPIRNCIYKIRI